MTAYYTADGKLLPAGERPKGRCEEIAEAPPRYTSARGDARLDRPHRPCACCGKTFKPTRVRRMLCRACYLRGSAE